jgi:hypothetical protein
VRHGQCDVDPGALADGRVDGDVAADLPNDAIDLRKPEAGAFARWFCREEGIERACGSAAEVRKRQALASPF